MDTAFARFNALGQQQAERELLGCCASPAWARRVAAGRPYPDLATAQAAAEAAINSMTWADIAEALAAHPRIGERADGDTRAAAWSRREQSGMDGADDEVARELVTANREYENRFGHVFLIFATGKTPADMLDAARRRLANDDAAERDVVRAELGKITRLRLERLLERLIAA